MTSIFDKFSDLDPVRERKQIETAHGSAVFDVYSHDPVRAEAQMHAALGASFDRFSLLDPEREQVQIDAALSVGNDEFVLQLSGENLQLNSQNLIMGA